MPDTIKEVSAGAVVFIKNRQLKYLLLHHKYKTKFWSFPKGKVEKGETPEQAAKREVKEETQLEVNLVKDVVHDIHYFYRRAGKTISKTVRYFLAKAATKDVKITDEHIGYTWLPFEKALRTLTHKNSQDILKKAHRFLTTL